MGSVLSGPSQRSWPDCLSCKKKNLSIAFQFESCYIIFLSNQPIPNFFFPPKLRLSYKPCLLACPQQKTEVKFQIIPKWEGWAQANKPLHKSSRSFVQPRLNPHMAVCYYIYIIYNIILQIILTALLMNTARTPAATAWTETPHTPKSSGRAVSLYS